MLIRRPWFTFTVASSHHQPHALAGRFQRADTPRQNRTCRRRKKYRTRVPAPALAPPATCLRGPRWRTRVRRSPSGSRGPRAHAPGAQLLPAATSFEPASGCFCSSVLPAGWPPGPGPGQTTAASGRPGASTRVAPAIENISWVGAAQLLDVGHALLSKRDAVCGAGACVDS